MAKLIILRGNSGSGKTTIAKELQKSLGRNTMLISQDVVRRDAESERRGEYRSITFDERTFDIW